MTKYQEVYEMLTPKIVTGAMTTSEVSKITAIVQLLEMRLEAVEKVAFEYYAESKREDLESDTKGEGAESLNELK